MRLKRIGLVAFAGFMLGGLVAEIGSASGGGPVADCDVCAKAKRCCDVVSSSEAACTYSAAKCSSMEGDARPAYVNACLTFLQATREAWKGSPPEECR